MTTKNIIAAIDFGTTFSGFAYSSKADFQKKPPVIHVNPTWKTGGIDVQFLKTPTSILFDQDKKFNSFGFEAEKKFASLALRNKHRQWYYFRRFKMMLNRSLEKGENKLTLKTPVTDETGKEMPAIIVFQESISYMMKQVTSLLQERGGDPNVKEDIHWVLTVPAIWDEAAKKFMREAAIKAGIRDADLSFALEPEAASLCCRHLQNIGPDGKSTIFKRGMRYTIMDLGGGTADIVSHELIANDNLKELHIPTGGDWGGTRVDSAFRQFIIKLVGLPILNQFKENHYADYLDFFKQFEATKQAISGENEDEVVVNLSPSLVDLFKKETNEDLGEAVQQSSMNNDVEYQSYRLILSAALFKSWFGTCTNKIISHVKKLYVANSAQNVNIILMVGGFSESRVVQSVIKKEFKEKKILIPENPALAIVKGAVVYGHCPKIIQYRICKLTYGFNLVREANADDISRRASEKPVYDGFDKLVTIGQEIEVGSRITREYTTVRDQQTDMCFMIYSSTEEEPKYTTDPECSLVGDLILQLSSLSLSKSVTVLVEIIFGETELTVRAKQLPSGKEVTTKLSFLST